MNLCARSFLPLVGWSILAATAAAKSDLPTPEQRHASIDQALLLVHPVASAPLPAALNNPFVLSRAEKPVGVSKPLAGDREILAKLATFVVPSGVVQVGDSPILLLGEKKLKVGDYLTIPFEGTDYVVRLVAISHSGFTLRFNKEEITQPNNP